MFSAHWNQVLRVFWTHVDVYDWLYLLLAAVKLFVLKLQKSELEDVQTFCELPRDFL